MEEFSTLSLSGFPVMDVNYEIGGSVTPSEEDSDIESKCIHCSQVFTNPRLLPCLHSMCRNCLHDLAKKVNSANIIVCPLCNETTGVPTKGIDAITPNIHLEHEAKIVTFEQLILKDVPPPCDECTREPKSIVLSFCCTCESFLCKECHSQHILSRKLTVHHKILTIKNTTDIREKLREFIIFPSIPCSLHLSEDIKFFCTGCKVLVCIQCALTKHSGHSMEDLDSFVSREKTSICEAVKGMPDTVAKLEGLVRSAKVVSESIVSREKVIGNEVKKVFAELIRHLNEREAALLKQCHHISHSKVNTLSAQVEKLTSLRNAIVTSTKFVNQSNDSYNVSEFVSVISTLHSRISNIKAKIKHTPTQLSEDDVIKFSADTTPLTNAFNSLGSIFICKPRDYTSLHEPIHTVKTSNAYHVAIHRSGDLIVANHVGDTVEIYNSSGLKSSTIGGTGKEHGQFQHPLGVSVVGDTLYVTEFNGGRCQKMTISGEFLCEIGSGQLKNAWGCTVAKNGVVYVVEEGNNRVQSFTPDGTILKVLCSAPLVYSPRDIAIDKQGKIHIACCGSKCVKVFDSSGAHLLKYGDGFLTEPSGVAVDNLGYCFVADWGGKSLHVFDPSGRHIHKVLYDGNISGVAIDEANHVYVVNHSVQTIYKY